MTIKWQVNPTKSVDKEALKLNKNILSKLYFLFNELSIRGPALFDWPNYGKLKGQKGDKRHCHLQKGKPTYVCCWEVIDKKSRIIEVYYVGTHEKAPY